MNKLLFIIVALLFNDEALASTCAAPIEIKNNSNQIKTISICLEYKETELNGCRYARTFKVPASKSIKKTMNFMCGYASDPELEEYWIVYQTSNSGGYQNVKYSKQAIVLN